MSNCDYALITNRWINDKNVFQEFFESKKLIETNFAPMRGREEGQ